MDDLAILHAYLNPGAAHKAGLRPDMLSDGYSQVLEAIYSHFASYGSRYPKKLLQEFPDVYCAVTEASRRQKANPQPIEFVVHSLRDRAAVQKLNSIIAKNQDEGITGVNLLQKLHSDLSGALPEFNAGNGRMISDIVGDVSEEYDRTKSGDRVGFQLPFEHLNDAFGGLLPGDLTAICGLAGSGKTYALLLSAMNILCGQHGFPLTVEGWRDTSVRTMIVSMEMTYAQIARRMACMLAGLPVAPVLQGKLDAMGEAKLQSALKTMSAKKEVKIFGPGDIRTISDLSVEVASFNPQVLFLDSFYKVSHGEGTQNDWRDPIRLLQLLRLFVIERDLPTLYTWQETKSQPGGKSFRKAFGTSAVEQESNNVAFITRDTMAVAGRYVDIEITKAREALPDPKRRYQWDLDTFVSFDSIGVPPQRQSSVITPMTGIRI